VEADEVGPDEEGEYGFPEAQVQEAHGEKPGSTPQASCEGMLDNLDLLRVLALRLCFHDASLLVP
jgi:hypothetical protein